MTAVDDTDLIAAKVDREVNGHGKVRCSRLPLALLCPASTVNAGPIHDAPNEAADIGTAIHDWLSKRIRHIDLDPIDVARRHAVDVNECSMLCKWAYRAWDKISDHFPDARTEVSMAFGMLTGTADVLTTPALCDGETRVLDFKSGRSETDHWNQVRGYAWMSLQNYPEATGAYGAVLRVRDQVIDGERWTRDELEAWYTGLEHKLAHRDRFNPGTHCQYCPRGLTCEAKTALIIQAAAVLLGQKLNASDIPADPVARGDFLSALIEQCRMIEKTTDAIRGVVKSEVALAGGKLPMSDGREICIKQERREPILFAEAWPLLQEIVPEAQFNDVFGVGKGALEKIVKASAGRGQKEKAYEMLRDNLKAVGALGGEVVEKLEIRKPK
jgi:hypothetical protein